MMKDKRMKEKVLSKNDNGNNISYDNIIKKKV